MVSEAEKYAAEDEQNKKKIEAKNGLENYCYSMKNTPRRRSCRTSSTLATRTRSSRRFRSVWTGLSATRWPKREFEAKQKELEGVVNPIMMKVYQSAGGGGMPDMGGMGGGAPPGGAGGPTVEEVD